MTPVFLMLVFVVVVGTSNLFVPEVLLEKLKTISLLVLLILKSTLVFSEEVLHTSELLRLSSLAETRS